MDKSWICDIKMLHGIAAYSRHHGPWKIHTKPPSFEQADKPRNLMEMPYDKIDGTITHITDDAQIKKICGANLLAVVIPMKQNIPELSNITENWTQTAEFPTPL